MSFLGVFFSNPPSHTPPRSSPGVIRFWVATAPAWRHSTARCPYGTSLERKGPLPRRVIWSFFRVNEKHTIPKFNREPEKWHPGSLEIPFRNHHFFRFHVKLGECTRHDLVKVNQSTPPYVATCCLTYLPTVTSPEIAGRPYMILWKPIGFPW